MRAKAIFVECQSSYSFHFSQIIIWFVYIMLNPVSLDYLSIGWIFGLSFTIVSCKHTIPLVISAKVI